MSETPEQELQSIVESARALIQWERTLGSDSIALKESARIEVKDAAPLAANGPSALNVLKNEAAACTDCGLHSGRTHSVFSRGNENADLVFVGEGPGYHEDQQGSPFVGRAGQLLDKMIIAMGFDRDEVYICNVVKCRPPDNRTPSKSEADTCGRFLIPQVKAVAPRIVVALGRCAAENLGVASPGGGKWRGEWGRWEGIEVMPTYHPAFLLRSPEYKRPVWEDLQQVMKRLGR